MKTWQHLLVAIADPFSSRQLAIRKTAAIASRCGARMTLFNAFSLPYPLPEPEPVSSDEALYAAIRHRTKALARLARPLQKKGISVDCVVEWDFPAHDAIIRHALKTRPDVVVAESHHHNKLARWLLANTDWELIRACPCPLWFVKSQQLPASLPVLAAVDPLHAHAKPAQLDDRILDEAAAVATQLGGSINMVHACTPPLSNSSATFIEPLRIPISPDRAKRFLAGIQKEVEALAKRHAVDAGRCFTREGDPVEVISGLVATLKANVLVMGAVSRSSLQKSFIGNTAEKLIDKVRCDVLIVKPAGFKTSVPRKSAAELLHRRAAS